MNVRLAARSHHPRSDGLHPVIVGAAGVQGHHRLAREEAGGDHCRHDPQSEDRGSFANIIKWPRHVRVHPRLIVVFYRIHICKDTNTAYLHAPWTILLKSPWWFC